MPLQHGSVISYATVPRFQPRLASVVFALGWTACAAARPSERSAAPSQPAPAAAAHTTAQSAHAAQNVTSTAPPKLGASEAWSWLRATLPEETANLRIDESRANVEKLLAWAAPGKMATLVFDRACRPLALTRNERTLDGVVHEKTSVVGRTTTVHRDGIAFGFGITVACGSDTSYKRDPRGAWVEVGSRASGCDHAVGHNLSEVRDGQIWFAAEAVSLSIRCDHYERQEQHCSNGSRRSCTTCSGAALDVTPTHGAHHVRGEYTSSSGSEQPRVQVDCASPCPVDALIAHIAAANAALADTKFEQLGHEKHPTLFGDRAACTAYRRKHPIARSDLDVW